MKRDLPHYRHLAGTAGHLQAWPWDHRSRIVSALRALDPPVACRKQGVRHGAALVVPDIGCSLPV